MAVLGILLMNVVSFRFDLPAYLNLSAGGSESGLDWAVGFFGEVFVDQKFMGLFSLLFGAGMILFIDRAARRGRRAVLLNLWRNLLLLLIGVLHFALWEGDILIVYAVCSVVLIAVRRLGTGSWSRPASWCLLQRPADAARPGGRRPAGDVPGRGLDFRRCTRQRGPYRPGADGLLPARAGDDHDRRRTLPGRILERRPPGAGIPRDRDRRPRRGTDAGGDRGRRNRRQRLRAGSGFQRPAAQHHRHDSGVAGVPEPDSALERPPDSGLKRSLRAVGRMALTNYLTQTVLGVLVLSLWLGEAENVNRAAILVFVFAVWGLQVWWSKRWLRRFRYGPAEWLWRCATYRSLQPLRRNP